MAGEKSLFVVFRCITPALSLRAKRSPAAVQFIFDLLLTNTIVRQLFFHFFETFEKCPVSVIPAKAGIQELLPELFEKLHGFRPRSLKSPAHLAEVGVDLVYYMVVGSFLV